MNQQGRFASFLESCFNVGVGFFIALAVWKWVIYPVFDIPEQGNAKDLAITGIFTFVSIVRGYFVRRLSVWWSEFRRRENGI